MNQVPDDKQEYAKFVSAVNQYVFEENGTGIAYTDNHFYAYYWNINKEPIPYIDVYLNADESQDVIRTVNKEYGIRGNQGARVYIDRAIERARDIQSRRNDSTSTNESTSSSRGDDSVGSHISRKGRYAYEPHLYVTSVRPDGRKSLIDNDIRYRQSGRRTKLLNLPILL